MIFGSGQRLVTRRQALSALGAAALMLAGCGGGGGNGTTPVPTPAPATRFIGRVIDANNGDRGVSGARVVLNGATAITINDGTFELSTANTALNYATVVGPDGKYYNNGYYDGIQYNLAGEGFPVQAAATEVSVDLGAVRLGSTDGPPFPPPI
jgi:hypothetical protein